jgi:endonuclease I
VLHCGFRFLISFGHVGENAAGRPRHSFLICLVLLDRATFYTLALCTIAFMKKTDIKRHLQDYSIFNKRKTTVNHAFASAQSISDTYDEEKVNCAIRLLGQDPDNDLLCVYCDKPAETWDHIKAVVENGEFSGHGHTISNLLPCCKNCNSKKANKDWRIFIEQSKIDQLTKDKKTKLIEEYIKQNRTDIRSILTHECKDELKELNIIRDKIFELMKEGDVKSKLIREKIRSKSNCA